MTKNHFCTKVRERRESHASGKACSEESIFSSTFVQDPLHEVVDRVPVIVVPDLAVEVSQVGAVEDRTLLLDELEEEGVLGALQADGPQSRKTEKKFREPVQNNFHHEEMQCHYFLQGWLA